MVQASSDKTRQDLLRVVVYMGGSKKIKVQSQPEKKHENLSEK
jgi:hypothetical protein